MRFPALLGMLSATALGLLSSLSQAATFVVTNVNDSGPGSLRKAILDANSTPGADTISFSIPGAGVHTIAPLSALPTITDAVTIDGRTQPGFSSTPLIELSGASAGNGVDGLHVTAGNSAIYALVINRFQPVFLGGGGNGIVLEGGGGNLVGLCFIGTNSAGTAALGNLAAGVLILNSSNNRVGDGPSPPQPALTNVISGNSTGVLVSGSSGANSIVNNLIGVDQFGFVDLGNFVDGVAIQGGASNSVGFNTIAGNDRNGVTIGSGVTSTQVRSNIIGRASATFGNSNNGIEVDSASGTVIHGNSVIASGLNGILLFTGAANNLVEQNIVGGPSTLGNAFNGIIASGANNNTIVDNVVGGNGTNGIRVRSGSSGNFVQGNLVGVDSQGISAVPNLADGIQVNDGAVGNTIGGSGAGQGNLVSGNAQNGIHLVDATTTGNEILGNRIGSTADGVGALGNSGHGVFVQTGASNNGIGGFAAGAGNRIAFNQGAGIFVESGTGNAMTRNSIQGNGGLGIDLAPAGVTPNDPGDGDTGPNNLQNFPVLLSQTPAGGPRTITGSLQSAPNATYRIEFFSSSLCDPSGNGEGETFLDSLSVLTDGSGAASFSKNLTISLPANITATATDAAGSTSEFSACLPVPVSFFTVTPCRLADTRDPVGPFGGPALTSGIARGFAVNPACGISAGALALSLNVTVTQAAAPGHVTVYPGPDVPATSTLNYRAGQTRANNVIVPIGSDGTFRVRPVQSSGTVQVIIDVDGYFE